MLDFLLKAVELKDETRTGWDLRNVEDPESVGDHSWGVALLCMLFADQEDIDKEKAIKMALVHDLTEAEIGDIATRKEEDKQEISKKDKSELEEQAIEKISALIGGG